MRLLFLMRQERYTSFQRRALQFVAKQRRFLMRLLLLCFNYPLLSLPRTDVGGDASFLESWACTWFFWHGVTRFRHRSAWDLHLALLLSVIAFLVSGVWMLPRK